MILHGRGEALTDGQQKRPFAAPAPVYIPPMTRHNVATTGQEPLEYVVAPAATHEDSQPGIEDRALLKGQPLRATAMGAMLVAPSVRGWS